MLIEAFIYYFWLPSGAWEPPYTANMKARVLLGLYFICLSKLLVYRRN